MTYIIIPADNGRAPERKGSKYLWLYAKENLPEAQKERFAALLSLNLKVGRAWAMKEDLRALWQASSLEEAQTFWKRWFWWATHTLPEKEVLPEIAWSKKDAIRIDRDQAG